MTNHLRITLLGGLTIELDGEPITEFASRKAPALIAYLACNAHSHPREVLAALLWEEGNQARSMGNLRVVLTSLRQLDPHIQITRQAVTLIPSDGVWVDAVVLIKVLTEVEQQVGKGGAATPTALTPSLVNQLEEALALYTGDFLAGFHIRNALNFENWMMLEQEKLHRMVLNALDLLVGYYLKSEEYARGIHCAERLLQLDNLHEETYQRMMLMLALSGQRNAALLQYETCQQLLSEELGVPPSAETTDLYERIRQGDIARPTAELIQRRTLTDAPLVPTVPHNLPAPLTALIGRQAETAYIAERLADPACRLLTLVGLGGVGKTRLSLEAAHQALSRAQEHAVFANGIYFVGLAHVSSPAFIVSEIASVLGFAFHGPGDARQLLMNHLRPRQMLLMLDNLEHLSDDVSFILELLEGAPGIKILASSRERLNIAGEWLYEIVGLPYPRHHRTSHTLLSYPAIQLFTYSAQQVQPHFAAEAELKPILRICQLVEGLPLGLQLAAASVRLYSCQQIADAVARNLDFLKTSMHNIPLRHRSMRAVFEHSWALLLEGERKAFQQLAIFAGGFTLDAAELVADVSADLLTALMDKSLLYRDDAGTPGLAVRYKMHEVLRQYAVDKLKAAGTAYDALKTRHCSYYAQLLQRQERALLGRRGANVATAFGADIEDVRSAWRWAIDHARFADVARMLEALAFYYHLRGPFHEGEQIFALAADALRTWLVQANAPFPIDQEPDVAALGGVRGMLGNLLTRQAAFLNDQGQSDQAITVAQEAIAIAQESAVHGPEAAAHLHWGRALWQQSDYEAAVAHLQTALDLARRNGFKRTEADSLRNLGIVALYSNNYSEARSYYQQSLRFWRDLGDFRGESRVRNGLGMVAISLGDYAEAQIQLEQALRGNEAIGDRQAQAWGLHNLGVASHNVGDFVRSINYYDQALSIRHEIGDRPGEGMTFGNLGAVYHQLGEYARAQTYYTQALQVQNEFSNWSLIALTYANLALLAHAQDDHERALNYGHRALKLAQEHGNRNCEAYARTCCGHALVATQQLSEAYINYNEALALRRQLHETHAENEPLAGLARVALLQNDIPTAMRLIEPILDYVAKDTALEGIVEPARVYLTCYHILQRAGDARANQILETAYQLLQARAGSISNDALRRSFLEQVPAHRAIIQEYVRR